MRFLLPWVMCLSLNVKDSCFDILSDLAPLEFLDLPFPVLSPLLVTVESSGLDLLDLVGTGLYVLQALPIS